MSAMRIVWFVKTVEPASTSSAASVQKVLQVNTHIVMSLDVVGRCDDVIICLQVSSVSEAFA